MIIVMLIIIVIKDIPVTVPVYAIKYLLSLFQIHSGDSLVLEAVINKEHYHVLCVKNITIDR